MAKPKRGNTKRGELIWHAFVQAKWAVTEPVFCTMQRVLAQRRAGVLATEEELAAAVAQRTARERAAAARREVASSGNVYVVPVCGIITQRASMMSEFSGGCSVEDLVSDVQEAMALPSVAAVLLDFDSPGGSVYGVPEAFDALKALRGQKPLIALCDPIAASAAYWLATACDAVYCIPSGEAGSVGVYMSHIDFSGMNDQMGIDVTYIHAGQYKVEGNADEPLSTDARAYYQKQIDDTYVEFVADVAEGRGLSTAEVMDRFGQGRCLLAKDALAAGMIDDICTFDDAVQRAVAPVSGRKTRRGTTIAVAAPTSRTGGTTPEEDDTDDLIEPNDDGSCPEGYELDEDSGMCRLSRQSNDDAMPNQAAARSRSAARPRGRAAGVVPHDVSEETAPKDTAWSKPSLTDFGKGEDWSALSDADKRHIAGHYAWAPAMPPETFEDLELPHHRASDGKVVFKGVSAAAGRLDQAAIPEADKPKVRTHLEHHYHQFDEKAPWESEDAGAATADRDRVAVSASAMAMQTQIRG